MTAIDWAERYTRRARLRHLFARISWALFAVAVAYVSISVVLMVPEIGFWSLALAAASTWWAVWLADNAHEFTRDARRWESEAARVSSHRTEAAP